MKIGKFSFRILEPSRRIETEKEIVVEPMSDNDNIAFANYVSDNSEFTLKFLRETRKGYVHFALVPKYD